MRLRAMVGHRLSLVAAISLLLVGASATASARSMGPATESATTTITRTASCSGADFISIDGSTEYNLVGTLRMRESDSGDTGFFVCRPDLPDKAVINRVRFTLRDVSDEHEAKFCLLARTSLKASSAGSYDTIGSVPDTGVASLPGTVRLTDTSISFATVDLGNYGYWAQCQLTGRDTAVDALGIFGADFRYTLTIPSGAPSGTVTRTASCHGFGFLGLGSNSFPGQSGTLRYRRGYHSDGLYSCPAGVPDGAVIKKVQFTTYDNSTAWEVSGCRLVRTGIGLGNVSSALTMASIAATGVVEQPGIRRAGDSSIDQPTVDATKWAYSLECKIGADQNANSTNQQQLGIYGASITYAVAAREAAIGAPAPASAPEVGPAGSTTRSFSCPSYLFNRISVDGQYNYDVTLRTGKGFQICRADLPQGATVTKVRFTTKDASTSAGLQFCGLVRAGLSAGTAATATFLGQVPDTSRPLLPGTSRPSDTSIADPVVDNTRYAYYFQCYIDGDDPTPDAGIYGATATYTLS